MDKLKKQIMFNIIIFFVSLAAIWFSKMIEVRSYVPFANCLTADFLFVLTTTLAGVRGSRWIDGYSGGDTWDLISIVVLAGFFAVYGVAIPLKGEAIVTCFIISCIWVFAFVICIEYGIIFNYTLKQDINPNDVAATDRYENDKH